MSAGSKAAASAIASQLQNCMHSQSLTVLYHEASPSCCKTTKTIDRETYNCIIKQGKRTNASDQCVNMMLFASSSSNGSENVHMGSSISGTLNPPPCFRRDKNNELGSVQGKCANNKASFGCYDHVRLDNSVESKF